MYPYLYGGWFLAVVVMPVTPVLILGVLAWIVLAASARPEDTAARIAKERFVRGEIDKEQLGILLNAL